MGPGGQAQRQLEYRQQRSLTLHKAGHGSTFGCPTPKVDPPLLLPLEVRYDSTYLKGPRLI